MKLSSITLQNFRGIRSMDIQLDGKSTEYFGINGVGKSSVLRAVDLLYANIIGRLQKSKKRLAEMNEDDIMFGKRKHLYQQISAFHLKQSFLIIE